MIKKICVISDYFLKKLVFSPVAVFPFRKATVQRIKTLLRKKILIYFWVEYFSSKLITLDEKSKRKKCIRILILNHFRYGTDLNVLRAHPDVHLIAIPIQYQAFINNFYFNNEMDQSVRNPEESDLGKKLINYLCCFIPAFSKRNRIDCVVSCSYFYKQDLCWQVACRMSHVPFIVLQKEYTVHECNIDYLTTLVRNRQSFLGNKILVHNQNVKELFVEADVCNAKDIVVTGPLRMDTIYKWAVEKIGSQAKKQIVLFSFLPMAGGVVHKHSAEGTFDRYSRYNGFVKLFEQVHGAMAEIAVENPGVDVVIKCKWLGKWEEMVNDAILMESRLCVNDIPNLIVTGESPYKYIEESMVVISFCSTSTIESRMYRRPVIIPVFAEASGKYNNYVYYKKYFKDYIIATSKEDLKARSLQYTENEIKAPLLPDEIVKEQVTYFDGKIVDRVVDEIRKAL